MSTISRSRSWRPPWLRSWAADSAALLFSQFAAVVATSTLAILLARHLGPRDWGIFSGFLGLSLALSVFVEFGLAQWLLRELARLWVQHEGMPAPDEVRVRAGQIAVASFAVNMALGALMIVGAGLASVLVGLGATSSVLLVALVAYGALIATCSGLEVVFRARRRLGRLVATTLLEKALLLLLVTVSLIFGFGLASIGIAYVVAGVARIAFDTIAIVRSRELAVAFPSLETARDVTRQSFPFAVNRASLNIIPKLDTFILAAISPVAAGYFALGDRALGPILIIPVVMSSALYPFLARESAGSRAGWSVVALLTAAGAVIAAIGIVLSPRLVPLVFGSNYSPAIRVVQVMLLTIPFVFAANPLLTHVYTARLEHRTLGLGLGAVSCTGTVLIVAGQTLVGPVGAAGGCVVRSALFAGVLAVGGTDVAQSGRTRWGGARRRPQQVLTEPAVAPNPEDVP
jgi:O-antigen/teichoic acid export membrane protein